MIRNKILLSAAFILALHPAFANTSSQSRKDALAALQPEIASYQASCPDEKIGVESIEDTFLTPSKPVVVITLGSSGTACFGNTVPSYLVTLMNGKWHSLGPWLRGIKIKPLAAGQQAATIVTYDVGMCNITYSWRKNRYVAAMSKDCKGLVPPHGTDKTAAELTQAVLR